MFLWHRGHRQSLVFFTSPSPSFLCRKKERKTGLLIVPIWRQEVHLHSKPGMNVQLEEFLRKAKARK